MGGDRRRQESPGLCRLVCLGRQACPFICFFNYFLTTTETADLQVCSYSERMNWLTLQSTEGSGPARSPCPSPGGAPAGSSGHCWTVQPTATADPPLSNQMGQIQLTDGL